ncbi:urea carboxylase [Emcibacter sp. SYSU 3D8]|uniref:urea carboxylase n=1 Tax=Emcibacter sp. SYSU 3D8 TaxID=3133969 RepID=UPI0031FEAA56
MFNKVLIANRGEIACRIIRTLRRMGVGSVAVYSDADRHARHVLMADEAVRIGPAPAAQSYLDQQAIIDACTATGAEAVHPGYGFLSENPGFAETLDLHGVRFIGPSADHMRAFGLKHTAREIAERSGVPLLPGTGLLADVGEAMRAAAEIGYPVMLKSTAGGGGIGMQLCHGEAELSARYEEVKRLSQNNFGDAGLFIEKFVSRARHIEVQVFGDGKGNVVALGERDCSLQRRNQKVVEETPAPNLSARNRLDLHAAAVALGKTVDYESAGTVEFVYDVDAEAFYFLEVNTRLQVEHCVTEEVFGVDLVEWMVRQAAGETLSLDVPEPKGAAIEVRIYAEDPAKDFRPSAGRLTQVTFPCSARVDGWVESGTEVPPYYDPMLAKLIVSGPTRAAAVEKLADALDKSALYGIETNLAYLREIARSQVFRDGKAITATLKSFPFVSKSVEVLAPGAQSSIQDWPGRIGYWNVGVPPSGPMDAFSFRLANRLVGNDEGAPGLEITLTGPTLRFGCDAVIALGGAKMKAALDGEPVAWWRTLTVKAGQTLAIGGIEGPGNRAYLAVAGGFDVPDYLGSGATFGLGGFGGHATGTLRTGDVLRLSGTDVAPVPQTLRADALPPLTRTWEIGVLYGPHGAPDFFTEADIETFFAAEYEVHFNSSRTGVRLIGPKPQWARADGGEAGLHPSNIHDNAYAIGAVDFTGDMPIILGPDGPSLGGFVCPAVIVDAELWKTGQLKPGDKVRFRRLELEEAAALRRAQDAAVMNLAAPPPVVAPVTHHRDAVLERYSEDNVPVCYRAAGDSYLLVEYGPLVLDIALRMRVHALMQAIEAENWPGIIDLTPGIRSLQIHYDSIALPLGKLLDGLKALEVSLPDAKDMRVPSRIVHLPLSWNDDQAQLAAQKYMELVRPDAPWCPSNIEFIRRINGLDSVDDVYKLFFDASYMVLGLGDVYLGAPVATPVDPRHRLVTTKYNPARTWTPENAVGIGGAYLCIYGMEGPGGYQLVGRTIQVWNTWRQPKPFEPKVPWLLRYFDQIRFFPVSADALLEARADFPHGRYKVDIEETSFSLKEYTHFLDANADGIAAFKATQQSAFEAERQRWAEQGLATYVGEETVAAIPDEAALPEGSVGVESHVPGNVWKLVAEPGQSVEAGDTLVIVESMKMELAIIAPVAGVVSEYRCQPGRPVQAGQVVAVLKAA